jgi:hypothetical protein
VFKRLPTMVEFRDDLAKAGIASGKDERGRWVMFHSLRHTLNTSLAKAGVDRTMRMLAMRHSDARLTDCTYLDSAMLPTAGLTDVLPDWAEPAAAVGVVLKSGTADAPCDTQKYTQKHTQGGVQTELSLAGDVTAGQSADGSQVVIGGQDRRDVTGVVTSGQSGVKSSAGRTRTYNIPVNSRMLYH